MGEPIIPIQEAVIDSLNQGRNSHNSDDVEMTAEPAELVAETERLALCDSTVLASHQANHENAPARRNRNDAPFSFKSGQVAEKQIVPQIPLVLETMPAQQ